MGHVLMENRNGLIVGAVTTRASGHAERLAALALIEPHADRPQPITLGADKGYDADGRTQRIRKRVEEAFGWAKTVAGLRKMRHRGLPHSACWAPIFWRPVIRRV